MSASVTPTSAAAAAGSQAPDTMVRRARGRTAIVTGAGSGIGRAIATLSRGPAPRYRLLI